MVVGTKPALSIAHHHNVVSVSPNWMICGREREREGRGGNMPRRLYHKEMSSGCTDGSYPLSLLFF